MVHPPGFGIKMHSLSRSEKVLRDTPRVRDEQREMGGCERHGFAWVPPRCQQGFDAGRQPRVWGSQLGCALRRFSGLGFPPGACHCRRARLTRALSRPAGRCDTLRPQYLRQIGSCGSRGPSWDGKRREPRCGFSKESRGTESGRRRKGEFAAHPPPGTFQKELSFLKLVTS